MAELLQLDAAAKMVGKSEVTLRRAVKAGKITAHKEKTLTGFIYRVDAAQVRAYYNMRETAVAGAIAQEVAAPAPAAPAAASHAPVSAKAVEEMEEPQQHKGGHAIASNGKVRLAVSNETGSSAEYWLKRAEVYEEKYHRELHKVSELREELGAWRGRAEHAQAMLMKMLPAPGNPIEVPAKEAAHAKVSAQKEEGGWMGMYVIVLSIIFVVAAAAIGYVLVTGR